MKNQTNPLLSISPIDGRYNIQTEEVSNYFSELAFIKYRVEIEIKYLIKLSEIGIVRNINTNEKKTLNRIIDNFGLSEAKKIKKIEETTHHDVKAIEYFIKDKLSNTSLSNIVEFIHFGLTSEDVNNIAIRLMLKDSSLQTLIPSIISLQVEILNQANKYKDLPMIARTHGQKAVPTTLGKEILVFSSRIENEINLLKNTKFNAKLNGAVGNYNALYFAYPKINWEKFSKDFISDFDLSTNLITTQIAPYEDIIYFFQSIQRINGIILDLNQDMWRYISDGYFIQENKKGEIGSSTMPQKVNPILFENSEGNIIIANSLIDGFVSKLPVSRLQRDLSGSTISRNFGVVFAHSFLAYQNTLSGLKKIKADKKIIGDDLNKDWSILSEAVQIYLKKEGIKNGYELVKNLTRGQKLTKNGFNKMVNKLPLTNKKKQELRKLSPSNYIGIIN